MKPMITRRDFLKCSVAGAVGTVLPGLEAAEDVRLKSWELVEIPSLPKKRNPILKLTATNGAVGFSKAVAKDLTAAAPAVKDANLLEHDKLYDLMMPKGYENSFNRCSTVTVAGATRETARAVGRLS